MGGYVVLTKTEECEGGAVGYSWTWKSSSNKVTLSTGVTGTISNDRRSTEWSNGISYTRAGPFSMVRADEECNDNSKERHLGTFGTLEGCAKACRDAKTCKTFIYGK